jgi:hypothetical protein
MFMKRIPIVLLTIGLAFLTSCVSPQSNQSTRPTTDAQSSGASTEQQQPEGQRIQILIGGTSDTQKAVATLVLAVSWTFSGGQNAGGGQFMPDAGYSKIIGPSGIAGTTSGPISLPFSTIFTDKDHPNRFYFTLGEGDLEIWWSDGAKAAVPGQNTFVYLSPTWLAASKELPATPEHPTGGISISSQKSNGHPLLFYIDFTGVGNFSGPTINEMGTQ